MAKCKRCPVGKISGSIGALTFRYSRGQQTVYLKPPKQKLTRSNTRLRNSGILLGMLTHLFKSVDSDINQYWKTRKKAYITPANLFVKTNLPNLYDSIPDNNTLMSGDNFFALDKLALTHNGKITEPFDITAISYKNNRISVNWTPETYNGIGKPDDIANLWAIYCEPAKKFSLIVSPKYSDNENFILKTFNTKSSRQHGCAEIKLDEPLNPDFLAVSLFFSDETSYSPTLSSLVSDS